MRSDVHVEMFAEQRIIVRYDHRDHHRIKETIGGRFVGPDHGGPGLSFVLELETCRRIREKLPEAVFSEEIMEWGRRIRDEQVSLVELVRQEDAELEIVKERLPKMFDRLRPYQRVGIKFLAEAPNPVIADQPGLGKTWQVIGGVYESGLADGPNLVVCPKIAIESVWLEELHRFQDYPVFVAPEGQKERMRLLEEVEMCLEIDQPFWLVVNPAMITYRKSNNADPRGVYDSLSGEYFRTQFPFLMRNQWNTVIVDEAHDCGLSNPSSQTSRALHGITTRKRIAMTGTPAGGKPLRYWGLLHWANPQDFRSKWQWQERWLSTEQKVNRKTGQRYTVVEGFKDKETEEKFYEEHGHYILRRTKREVAPEMPAKNYIPVWVLMNPEQEAQYLKMEDEAEAILGAEEEERGTVSSANTLTTYQWLKQFSFGLCEVYEKGKKLDYRLEEYVMKYGARAIARNSSGELVSPKLEALYDIMNKSELEDASGTGKMIVFSYFEHVITAVTDDLVAKGFRAKKITGKTTDRQYRAQVQQEFQHGDLQIVLMTLKAGGTAITLDVANDVVFFDEDWNPDNMEQAEDRADRISRIRDEPLNVWTIRTKHTVDEEVLRTVEEKREINDVLLDRYRRRKAEKEIEF